MTYTLTHITDIMYLFHLLLFSPSNYAPIGRKLDLCRFTGMLTLAYSRVQVISTLNGELACPENVHNGGGWSREGRHE